MNTHSSRLVVSTLLSVVLLSMVLSAWSQPIENDIASISARFTASELFITAAIEPGWHIYSITQPPGGPVATKIKLAPSDVFRVVGDFQAGTPPDKKREEVFGDLIVESHYESVTWYAPIELSPGVNPADLQIEGVLTVQPCDANTCLPPRELPFIASLDESVRELGVPLLRQKQCSPETQAQGFDPNALVVAENEQLEKTSLALAIAMGLLGGLILNLMPCVLPVIGLKVLSFIEQAGHSRSQALLLNVWYSLGLLSVFLLLATLAVFAGFGWGQLFSYQGFNITLAAVVFVMGLSFLGVWEIPIPGFAGRGKAIEVAEKEGAAGAFAKGVLTTILATPCSAPLLAPALAWAVAQPPPRTYAVFTSVGVGMALPYLLIGAFPKLIGFLPKPGAWMDTFKQIMGFVLLGTVVFLLTFIQWSYVVPTVGLLFGLWGACWWIGRVPPTADTASKTRAWLEAAAFTVVVWIITFPGIDEIVPGMPFGGLRDVMEHRLERTIQQGVATQGVATQAVEHDYKLPWRPFTRAALEESIAAGKTVLVDFTANWCLTCKTLENTVLNTSKIRAAVDSHGIVTLHADWTHGSPEVTEILELLGSKQVPTLAIFPADDPNRPIVLRGGYTQATLLESLRKAGASK